MRTTRAVEFIGRASNWVHSRFTNQKIRFESVDETVEGQAKTFRIWIWASTAGLMFLLLLMVSTRNTEAAKPETEKSESYSLSDNIPAGFVLVPIEPVNFESLDAVFSNYGFADLYSTESIDTQSSGRGKRIARGVPLMRAPKNPNRFAVLIPEENTTLMANLALPVAVALRKAAPKQATTAETKNRRPQKYSPFVREKRIAINIVSEELPEIEKETE